MDGTWSNTLIQKLFDTLPLAQFKHLPDVKVLGSFSGGGTVSLNDGGEKKKSSRDSTSPKISIKRKKTMKK